MKKLIFVALLSFGSQLIQAQTFSSGIAELFYNKCTFCHHTGGIAPFNLVTYQDVANNVGSIYDAVIQDRMPPWPPNDNYSELLHSRALSASEKSTLINWLNNGIPEGNSAETPAPPVYPEGSILGDGDLELQIPTYTSTASSFQDDYVCISVPTGLTVDKKIRAIEVVAGNPEIVHHALIYIDVTGQYQTDLSGTCTGPSGNNYKLAAGFVPGTMPMVFPNNPDLRMGLTLPAGSNIVFAMHYPSGSGGQEDDTKVILHFYPDGTPGIREVEANPILQNWNFFLPANQQTTVNASQFNASNLSMLSIFPHMHLIGKSIEAYATQQTDTIKLIQINDWDFHWQGFYVFKNLQKIPSGYTIRGRGVYDNTTNNLHNPNNPPQNVGPGLNTHDEMFIYYAHYMPYQAGDELHDLESMVSLNLEEFVQTKNDQIKAFPNPFDASVLIDLSQINFSNALSIAVYDTQGKCIRKRLEHQNMQAVWDGLSDAGSPAPAGVYYISVLVDGKTTFSTTVVKR